MSDDASEKGEPQRLVPQAIDVKQRTHMAAERTWLAWWRTALTATAGSLAVGRFAPELLDVAPAPYIVLGLLYAALAVGLLTAGAYRQNQMRHGIDAQKPITMPYWLVAVFTFGGVTLAVMTVVLVIVQA